jgi:hypothetical protein
MMTFIMKKVQKSDLCFKGFLTKGSNDQLATTKKIYLF